MGQEQSSDRDIPSVNQKRKSFIGPNQRYTVVQMLNEGNFGRVGKALDTKTNTHVAIKFIERGPRLDEDYVTREIINHRGLWHHHIIGFNEVFLTKDDLCIVMEYAPGGDLHQYVKIQRCLPEEEARWFFQQLVVAVEYCHKKKIVLRDVKLENLLLDSSRNNLKLCDFGFSKSAQIHSEPNTTLGTPSYIAPELLRFPANHVSYNGAKVDIWTCGVSLFVMIFGHYPFDNPDEGTGDDTRSLLARIRSGEVDIPTNRIVKGSLTLVSEDCINLLRNILERDPARRYSIQDIMADPWFKEGLPSTVCGYNERLGSVDESTVVSIRKLQSVQEIQKLVRKAATR